MSVASTLFGIEAKRWLTRRGFLMVLAVAALPLVLTGAWLVTHQNDLAPIQITWEPQELEAGDLVNFTAIIKNTHTSSAEGFDVLLRVGFVENTGAGPVYQAFKQETIRIEGLRPGESRELVMNWTAEPGTYRFDVEVDPEDEVPEIEERDNVRYQQVFVAPAPQDTAFDPTREVTNGTGAEVDLEVVSVTFAPNEVYAGETTNVTVVVHNQGPNDVSNGTVHLQVHPVRNGAIQQQPDPGLRQSIEVAAGATETVTFEWIPRDVRTFFVVALADTGPGVQETDPDDNANVQELFVDRKIIFEEPEEKATIKAFFVQVITSLQVRIVIPLLALAYAAGVLADPQRRGALVYLLTRPIPRWMLPLTRFAASFIVAWLAIVVGSLLAFIALLQSPEGNLGFLTVPLVISTLALFAYTSVFVLLGVITERPYLWGLGFVIGWETFAGLLLPWVSNLTLNHHLILAARGMEMGAGAVWFPSGAEASGAAWRVILIGFGALLAAAAVMSRREFRID